MKFGTKLGQYCRYIYYGHPIFHHLKFQNASVISFKRFCHSRPKLSASPTVALHDVVPVIKVEGLKKGAPVTLEAEMVDDIGKKLISNAHYVADDNGEVDVMHDSSIGGCYQGVFPTGLLSTLQMSDGRFGRLTKKNMEVPFQIKVSLKEGHESLGNQGKVIDSITLERHFLGPGVKAIPVKNGRVRGMLFLPSGDGPYPGVIDMFGATGRLFPARAALNASRGIASLALAYVDYEDIPALKVNDLDLEYFEESTEFLLSQPGVIPDRCGVLGSCLGGFISQYMGIHFDKVKAVFAANFPTNFFFPLSYKGKAIYRVPPFDVSKMNDFYNDIGSNTFAPSDKFHKFVCDTKGTYAEYINEAVDTHFYYVHGEGDSMQMMNGTRKLVEGLSPKQKKNVTLRTIPKAGHSIDVPYNRVDRCSYMILWRTEDASVGANHYWGGEAFNDVQMQDYVWNKSFEFFNRHIRDQSPWYQQYLRTLLVNYSSTM